MRYYGYRTGFHPYSPHDYTGWVESDSSEEAHEILFGDIEDDSHIYYVTEESE